MNEETNQTVDYAQINKIEKPEGFEEDAAPEEVEEGEEEKPRVSLQYVAGRLFLDDNGRWVYESL